MDKLSANILIIDDDPVSLEQSRDKISLYADPNRIFTAQDSVQIMKMLREISMDLIFIDVEMPETDGFSVADYIRANLPQASYVFLTGHTELGAKSYDYEPLDFLCKPLDALRLGKTFERFQKSRGEKKAVREQIAIEGTSGFVLVSPADVLYITRENRRTVIHCTEGRYPVRSSLDELELIFGDYSFFRCHQSYLAALLHITQVVQADYGRTYWAVLDSGDRIPVSRGRYIPLREKMQASGTHFL